MADDQNKDPENNNSSKKQSDKVTEAYENITKRLETLRSTDKDDRLDAKDVEDSSQNEDSDADLLFNDKLIDKNPIHNLSKDKLEESEDDQSSEADGDIEGEVEEEDTDTADSKLKPSSFSPEVEQHFSNISPNPLMKGIGEEESDGTEDREKLNQEENNLLDESNNEKKVIDQPDSLSDLAATKEEGADDKDNSFAASLNNTSESSFASFKPKEDEVAEEIFIPRIRPEQFPSNSNLSVGSDEGSFRRNRSFSKDDDPSERQSHFMPRESKRQGSKAHLLILALIGLAVIGATVYFLKNGVAFLGSSGPTPTPVSIVESTPFPTPVPTPAFDRSKYTVRVLNGTTKTGFAASVSASLKDLGYQTEKTANATNSAFKTTVVRVKPSATGLLEQLISDLAGQFQATGSSPLKETDSFDAEVILGLE